MGSGCVSLASDSRGTRFESSHGKIYIERLLSAVLKRQKEKEKRGRGWPILKQRLDIFQSIFQTLLYAPHCANVKNISTRASLTTTRHKKGRKYFSHFFTKASVLAVLSKKPKSLFSFQHFHQKISPRYTCNIYLPTYISLMPKR